MQTQNLLIGILIGVLLTHLYISTNNSKEKCVIIQYLYDTDIELKKCKKWIKFLEDDTKQGKRIKYLEFKIESCVSLKRDYDKWLKNKLNVQIKN